ncbi:unnamed protein product [Arabidopsis halleri]
MKTIPLMFIALIIVSISFPALIKAQGIVGCDAELDKCEVMRNNQQWGLVYNTCCKKLKKPGPQPCMCLFFKYPALKETALSLLRFCHAPIPKC